MRLISQEMWQRYDLVFDESKKYFDKRNYLAMSDVKSPIKIIET